MAKLKVYCTPIGFHDAYVAAPSQKAALAAWGSGADLFARKQAYVVDDAEQAAEALARPGEVIKRVRGSTEEHLAALPTTPAKSASQGKRKRLAGPRPSRAALDTAEAELAKARSRFDAQLADVAAQEEALARARKQLQRERDDALRKLETKRDRVSSSFEAAMMKWRAE